MKNQIIELHNHAKFDALYGVRLYSYLKKKSSEGLMSSADVDKIYILSVDWPDCFIEPLEEWIIL